MDSLDYGVISPLASLREQPSSDESFASSVDDTFSFVFQQPRRNRVDTGASSFCFRTSGHSQVHPYARVASGRRHEPSTFVASLSPIIITGTPPLVWETLHNLAVRAGALRGLDPAPSFPFKREIPLAAISASPPES